MAAGRPLDCLYGTGTAPGVAEPLGCEAGAGAVGSRPRPRGELPGLAVGGEGWRGAGSSSPSRRARWHEGVRGLSSPLSSPLFLFHPLFQQQSLQRKYSLQICLPACAPSCMSALRLLCVIAELSSYGVMFHFFLSFLAWFIISYGQT